MATQSSQSLTQRLSPRVALWLSVFLWVVAGDRLLRLEDIAWIEPLTIPVVASTTGALLAAVAGFMGRTRTIFVFALLSGLVNLATMSIALWLYATV